MTTTETRPARVAARAAASGRRTSERRARAVLEPEPPKARRAPFVLLVLGLLGGGLAALLVLNTAAAAAEVRQRNLAAGNATTQDEVQQLQLDIANKQAPGALASAATKLGMIPNGNPAFLAVRPDGTVVVLGSPVPAAVAVIPSATPTAAATATAAAGATPTAGATAKTGTTPTAGATPTGAGPTAPTTSASVVDTLPGGAR